MVTRSGSYDGTFRYYYDGHKIIEVRDGSGAMVQQFLHGTQYIDEVVMVRVKDKGELYVHQDANWNVIGTTDLGGRVVEHTLLSPYGEVTVNQETGFGDRDGDGEVDSVDKGTVGTTCTGTVSGSCRILDLDFDGDYDSTDATKFDSLPQGYMIRAGLIASRTSQPYAHQGLLFEPEIGSYQNRARQYEPNVARFMQVDPLARLQSPVGIRLAGLNFFAYHRSNPVRFLDWLGLMVVYEECLEFRDPIPPAGDPNRIIADVCVEIEKEDDGPPETNLTITFDSRPGTSPQAFLNFLPLLVVSGGGTIVEMVGSTNADGTLHFVIVVMIPNDLLPSVPGPGTGFGGAGHIEPPNAQPDQRLRWTYSGTACGNECHGCGGDVNQGREEPE